MPEQQLLNGPNPARPLPPLAGRVSNEAERPIDHFAHRVVVALLLTVLILSASFALWRSMEVLLETFAGILLALFLSTLSNWLSERSLLSYHVALITVIVTLFAIIGAVGWLLADAVGSQVAELTEKVPQSFAQIRDYLAETPWGQHILEQVPKAATSTLTEVGGFSRVTGLISGVAHFLVAAVVILFVGIFGASNPSLYRAGLLHLVPAAHRKRAAEAVDATVFNLRWWLLGQVCLMLVMWLTTTAGLWLLGIPLAITLGLIAGALEIVPYVGPWLSVVPAALVALLISPWHLVWVLLLYLGLHILEGYVLLPLIQDRVVAMPPALTLVMQVLLGELLGALGLVVAAPLTVVVVVLLKMLYVEDTLGDEAVEVPGEPEGNPQPEPQKG